MRFSAKPAVCFLLSAFLFSGCDLLDKADDVKFTTDFTLPQPFVVDEDLDDPQNPYLSINSSIEAEADPEYQKYKAKVKDIVVNEIRYTISDFSADGPVTLTSGKAYFFEVGGTAASGSVAEVQNLSLSNTSGILQASPAALEAIADILLEKGEIEVASSADVSDSPVHFKVTVTLNVTITANALD
jgi:hypothetical protein